jgi:hypothetical protein
MSVAVANSHPIYRSARELLPALLHDLAQPTSALECSAEVALQRPRSAEDYVEVLAQAHEIAAGMRTRLEYFRRLAGAVEVCDCMRPVRAETALMAAVEAVRPLAESLGTAIELVPARFEVFGNQEKLVSGLVWLLDYLLMRRRSIRLQLRVDQSFGGEVRLLCGGGDRAHVNGSEDSLTVAQTAFATMGVEVRIEPCGSELMVEVQLSSYRHPASNTLVMIGDF